MSFFVCQRGAAFLFFPSVVPVSVVYERYLKNHRYTLVLWYVKKKVSLVVRRRNRSSRVERDRPRAVRRLSHECVTRHRTIRTRLTPLYTDSCRDYIQSLATHAARDCPLAGASAPRSIRLRARRPPRGAGRARGGGPGRGALRGAGVGGRGAGGRGENVA